MLDRSLLAEIEGTFASGSAGKQADTLRRITDLFLAGASNYSGEQVDLFDGVISRLAERIETKARIELANRLAPVSNAPATTVRQLARDPSIEVASPILSQSPQLTDKDLLAIAADNSQERLLAISKRAVLSANIGDVLAARGNRDVVLSVTQNEGARFSDIGYDTLVDRSIDDEVLAICVGMRKDIPRDHFHALISKASEAVFDKLAASNPAAVAEVQKVAARPKAARDYREAEEAFDKTRRAGKSADAALQEFASAGKFFETVAALSALSQAPREFVESVMSDRRGANDSALLLAKAAGLSWSSAKAICILRRGPGGIPPLAIEAARQAFERLRTETAQRVVRFYNERHNALGAFERLAQHVEEDGGPPMPRAATRAASRG
jgi:uncharacterized protein (DUF2336 family)